MLKIKRMKSECERQFLKNNRFYFFMTIIALFLCAILNICMAFMLKFFIEAVEYKSMQILNRGFIIVIFYIIIYALFGISQTRFKNTYMRKALSQFKDYIFEKMLNKTISDYGNGMSSKFISAFSNDLNSIESNYLRGTLDLILTIMLYIGAIIAALYMKWTLALPIIIVSMICISLSLIYGRKLVSKEQETSKENMSFVAQVKDLLNGFIVIKSFKAEKEVLEIFRKQNTNLEVSKQGRRVTSDTVSIYGDISSIVVNSMIFGLGFLYAFNQWMSIGMVIAFIQLGNYILAPVRNLAPLISNRNAAIKLINMLSEAIEEKDEKPEGIRLSNFQKDIVFKDVSFSFESEKLILDHLNLTFEKGKSYAIVGGNGSGKSTILKMLLGFYNKYEGDILIDGIQIRNVDLSSLYDNLSIIQQDVFLFDSTIKNNITMFASFDEQKINDAIEQAGLAALIAEKGDDYSCGEEGKNLSGGEKQRVSIARCLVRGTPILLMDEATSALDNNTSSLVENEILSIKNLTRIIVTHRFNETTMKKFDRILVMNKGKIIEEGTFDTLINDKGYFYSLYSVAEAE